MADQNAVTHGSYDGPVCKFCGAVLTCLSCGGNMGDPEQELRRLNDWLTNRLKALWPMKDTADYVFTDILTIRMLMREAYNLGARATKAAASAELEKHGEMARHRGLAEIAHTLDVLAAEFRQFPDSAILKYLTEEEVKRG